MDSQKKELFLTFDDGPIPGPTEMVLDKLAEYGIKGTFFCIGDNIQKHPGIFGRIINEGHTVGNHTFHHVNGWRYSIEEYIQEVNACENEINNHNTSKGIKLFRPPYGRIKRKAIPKLDNYKIIMWDVLSVDYSYRQSPSACYKYTQRAVRPGSIIVFHDSLKAEKNLKYALPKLIESCLNKGYTFKSLTL